MVDIPQRRRILARGFRVFVVGAALAAGCLIGAIPANAVENPAPSLSSLSPVAAAVGSPGITLTVDGAGFVPESQVLWSGVLCDTVYVSPSQLTAQITAAMLATEQIVSVTVRNPPPGGGFSPALAFVVGPPNPVPQVTGLSPERVPVGSGPFGMTVIGSGFVPGSTVYWNGEDRATGYIAPTMLTATIRASDIALPGFAVVSVMSPAPGGGASSSTQLCSIVQPAPELTSLAPSSCWAGSAGFTLTLTGSHFMPSSVVHWAGVARATRYISPEKLQATISASDVRYAGSVSVRVYTAGPGGGLSEPVFLAVLGDETPPVTRVVGLQGLWHRSSTSFTLVASDVGLGVAWTFYQIDATAPVRGTKVTVPAPSTHANDGMHTVKYYSVDQVLNWEPESSVQVGIDTRPPTTSAADARVKRGASLSVRYRISDALSTKALDGRLLIVDRKGVVRMRCSLGQPRTNVWHGAPSLTVPLPRGAYRLKILAHDLAGNAQGRITAGDLTVY